MAGIKQKIEQCKKDIETLQANLKVLEEEERIQTTFKPGDIVENENGYRRLIVSDCKGRVFSVDVCGRFQSTEKEFRNWGYKKIGYISDFIKEKNERLDDNS